MELWCTELETRFTEYPSVALPKLEQVSHTLRDVRAGKDAEESVRSSHLRIEIKSCGFLKILVY